MLRRIPYYLLKWTSSARHWINRRFTYAGILLLLCLLASSLLGLDTNKTTAYEIFTLLLSLLLVSIALTLFSKGRFELTRTLPRMCSAGERTAYTIRIKNLTGREMAGLSLTENLPDPRPELRELDEEMIKGGSKGYLKRLFSEAGYFGAWRRHIRKNMLADIEVGKYLDVPPMGKAERRVELLPLRRGYIRFKEITLSRPDPFGIIKKLFSLPGEDSLLVLPKRYPLPPINLPGRRMHNQGGVTLTSDVGNSDEFMALRDYRPGDPLRTIHWKSWAKTGKPVVKEFEDEHFSRHALILDTFGDKGKADLFEEAVSVAASLASSLEKGESLLDLIFVGDQSYCFTTGRNTGSSEKMLEILACVELCQNKPFGALADSTMERASLLSSAICILLDWDKTRQDFVSKLSSLGIPIMVFLLSDSGDNTGLDLGVMKGERGNFHILEVGKVGEALAGL